MIFNDIFLILISNKYDGKVGECVHIENEKKMNALNIMCLYRVFVQ